MSDKTLAVITGALVLLFGFAGVYALQEGWIIPVSASFTACGLAFWAHCHYSRDWY